MKKSQNKHAIRVFTAVNPMDDDQSMENSMRLGQAKDRTIQKYLETSSKLRYMGAI